ncbi:MAG: DEAD/DEAH box helicase family protein [Ureaplasma sp.]|nr:DEAD/DEAH box helicase family protein [Ureaplasma sp.]MDE7264002.1 DEAD/DEAH box helicase family protein [Anaeroplasmataceae bacterium]
MSYRELKLKKCYETSADDNGLLDTFYIPMLRETARYYRIAGFFNSTSLAIAAKGIEALVCNNSKTDKEVMRLLISPELSIEDIRVLNDYTNGEEISDTLDIFKNFDESDFEKNDRLKLLAWLLANNKLKIKIVVDKKRRNGIFHQKLGIGIDINGNMISFSGSINETASAWLGNIEEFKVFTSWNNEQSEYLINDLKKFNSFWNDERKDFAEVYEIPESIKKRIIIHAPQDIYDLAVMKDYKNQKKTRDNSLSLFKHQSDGVLMWIQNNYRLLFEMATGTGKTRTAIGCFLELLKIEPKLLIIVSTPQNTLSRQWMNDIKELGIVLDDSKIIDGTNSKWRKDLEVLMLNLTLGIKKNAIIYTSHATVSDCDFIKIVKKNKSFKILFIGDEVHAMGSKKQQMGLLEDYDYRIGLSATPERMFDESGTSLIKKYFGNKSFEFSIFDALHTINPITGKAFLNSFCYYPRIVQLSEQEFKEYQRLSQQIIIAYDTEEQESKINMLKMKRADILKNAEMKISELSTIIDEMGSQGNIKDTIIFVSDKSEQIKKSIEILTAHKITRSKITMEKSAKKMVDSINTERQAIISQFKSGDIQVLLGIKCLDEGIDIPNARIAILMASSINPREYVQRVGRVIRQSFNKLESIIYDMIVVPQVESNARVKIIEKEAKRAKLIAENATNYIDVKRIFKKEGVDLECL